MKTKRSKYAIIALFLALLYVPTLVWLAAGDSLKAENQENRTLAELPTPSLDSLDVLPGAYEAYYADHQPFRDQLINLRALMSKKLYDRDISQLVIFGKEDWLFYAQLSDGAPILDYRGEDRFSDKELRKISMNLIRTRNDLKELGCDFVLFIAPNKERMYSEYMPDRFGEPAENYGVKQLVAYLRKRTNLKVVYAYDDLMQAKRDFPDIQIYYARDTHWNLVGGYIGTRALLKELDIELPELTRDMIVDGGTGPNDLVNLSHLPSLYAPESTYAVNVALPVASSDDEKKVLYFRHDSFGEYMDDYLEPLFSERSMMTTQMRNDEWVDSVRPDVYVIELVERNVRTYLSEGPLYASPENRMKAEEDDEEAEDEADAAEDS